MENKKMDKNNFEEIKISSIDGIDKKAGIVYVPYTIAEHTEESLKEYDSFMNSYKNKHKYCPKCGSDSCTTTLMSYLLIQGKEEEYKDLNSCVCQKCQDCHSYHDRIGDDQVAFLVSINTGFDGYSSVVGVFDNLKGAEDLKKEIEEESERVKNNCPISKNRFEEELTEEEDMVYMRYYAKNEEMMDLNFVYINVVPKNKRVEIK